jgi:PadR family transcriptional regulator PadR
MHYKVAGMADTREPWESQLRKGMAEVLVLNALQCGEAYAYDLARAFADLPGGELGEGTLYPLLSRLRQQGLVSARLVESPSGPARKYYSLTPAGERARQAMNLQVEELVSTWRTLRDRRSRT